MIDIDIPDFGALRLAHLVLDYNGTLAVDGDMIPGVRERLVELSEHLGIHILTADTFGKVKAAVSGIPCDLSVLAKDHQDRGKLAYVDRLGPGRTVSMGNGRNDRLMLNASALGIAVMLAEGTAVDTLTAADIVCADITDALDLLTHPLRVVATLRS